jgi:Protein of unknown function (DUF3638)
MPHPDDLIGQARAAAGLWRSVVPSIALPTLCSDTTDGTHATVAVTSALGATTVLWTQIQKCDRCLALVRSGSWAALQLELANTGHSNWQPCAEPGWLLLELEGDFLIRAKQVDVARAMQDIGSGSTSLQMNMGEGKSSVIVPMLAVAQANRSGAGSSSSSNSGSSSSSSSNSSSYSSGSSSSLLVRLTVPGPLLALSFTALTHQLGELLQRRCYRLPCRRDMLLDAAVAEVALAALQECANSSSLLHTLPEHRQSLQLKAHDLSRCGRFEHALALHALLHWQHSHARDYIDEVDDVLRLNNQLVYTVGAALPLDGADWRWRTVFAVLKSAARCTPALAAQHGPEAVEWHSTGNSSSGSSSSRDSSSGNLDDSNSSSSNTSSGSGSSSGSGGSSSGGSKFSLLRILRSEAGTDLLQRVARDLLSGGDTDLPLPQLLQHEQQQLQQLLLQEEADGTVLQALQLLPEGPARDVALTLRGLLAYGVLLQVLAARWRVNYGVSDQHRRLMAVPFRYCCRCD